MDRVGRWVNEFGLYSVETPVDGRRKPKSSSSSGLLRLRFKVEFRWVERGRGHGVPPVSDGGTVVCRRRIDGRDEGNERAG